MVVGSRGPRGRGGRRGLHVPANDCGSPELAQRRWAVVPGDRQREGIVTGLGLRDNFPQPRRNFGAWTRTGFRRPRRETRAVLRVAEMFGVVPQGQADRVSTMPPSSKESSWNQETTHSRSCRSFEIRYATAVREQRPRDGHARFPPKRPSPKNTAANVRNTAPVPDVSRLKLQRAAAKNSTPADTLPIRFQFIRFPLS